MSLSPRVRSTLYRTAICLLYSICSISMLFVNKASIKVFDNHALVLWQLLGCCFLLPFCMFLNGEIDLKKRPLSVSATVANVWRWTPKAMLFLSVLQSSTYALLVVGPETITVFRTLTTLCVAIVEVTWFGTNITRGAQFSLVLTIIGAVIYANADIHYDQLGYMYIVFNVLANSSYSLFSRFLVQRSTAGALELTFWNNLSATLVMLGVEIIRFIQNNETISFINLFRINKFLELSLLDASVICASVLVAVFLSWTVTLLSSLLSATGLMALNNSIKIFLAVVTPWLSGTVTTVHMQVGAAACLGGGALYSFFQLQSSAKPKKETKIS